MKEAMFYDKNGKIILCNLCPHHCKLKNGQTGRCGVRKVLHDKLYSLNYGEISVINVDPIEKKPIVNWMKGSKILSIGSFGCNLHCGFCQNYEISLETPLTVQMKPSEIVDRAIDSGVPSIAYTYNEPTVFYEMMYDVAKLARRQGIKNVMVTNGFIDEKPLMDIIEYIDAINIDLKTYNDDLYKQLGGRTLNDILKTIEIASKRCYVEISLLIVPGISDQLNEMEELFKKLYLINKEFVLHISRYFPVYRYDDPPTDIGIMTEIREKALKYFKNVYLGNVR
ncbi:AmmeMemoRadiSam system radical SAM enzyme [Alkalibaculum sp. M08DMB]|uniref:AmmeMemoRadiSam system radical SAM enzyme n=1 Tax=Alkalibaculum sporogenes TaxID=2655001 RepID=A0A6A7K572_9FIRM|nr:AmmeMemoRadiSam system radical SAM enzyme [Alkalibaculum sporogenes]MPW24548.1 AmmeMemoRadiSam system radical SAM enzyme [Alkalibaculum sporogenes]